MFLQTSVTAVPTLQNPLQPPDTSSPQATMKSFMENLHSSHEALMEAYDQYMEEPGLFPSASVQEKANIAQVFFDRASECLDISQVGDSLKTNVKTEVTLLLKEVFDRIDLPYHSEIPNQQAILDLREKNIELNNWRVPKTAIEITKVQEGERAGEYLFSPETVAQAANFYQTIKEMPYNSSSNSNATEGFYEFYSSTPGQLLPPKWFVFLPKSLDAVFWDQTLWQWLGMIIVLFFTGLIVIFMFKWNQKITAKFKPTRKYLFRTIPAWISIALLWVVGDFINYQLNITGYVLILSLDFLYFSWWVMVAFVFFFLAQAVGEVIIRYFRENNEKIDAELIRNFADLISLAIGGIVVLFGLQRIGLNLFPLLAGLGVGGVAIALGAKSTLENVIAGLALFFDQPVVAGEECIFGGNEGAVQSVGLRSIRLQGVDGNLMSMPNSEFCQLQLINKSRAEKSLFKHRIHLSYETKSQQLKSALDKFRKLLVDDENILEAGLHVRCVGYNEYSIVVEFQAYIDTGDEEEFLLIQEGLLLKVKQVVEEVGTKFAMGV
ncbi:mechanosensitive ion channel family protein [Roseofilum capinflatum]|uniref:Mechanosensitive ion channel n=1 Tax=Roseofilum capinflatum BLCC-M114 TaxID=3022440 RepID=A0ABT7B523_9CYAN|nr:mechanosensitive ion channel domain-containing protein [Roseofilum capinflatum]MDJ1174268.1 mechanosensitive ion channel [Roseofilum capinflatum BLCC-M114]